MPTERVYLPPFKVGYIECIDNFVIVNAKDDIIGYYDVEDACKAICDKLNRMHTQVAL